MITLFALGVFLFICSAYVAFWILKNEKSSIHLDEHEEAMYE